jgi:hypothetical protein
MRRALIIALLLMLAGPVWAQSAVTADDQAAIRGVITRQIEAFKREDGEAAFAFASPHIQEQFGDPGRFLDMVRRGYPAVHRPRSVDFSELLIGDGTIVQQVELVGPDGQAELALYSMQRDSAGRWRIDGCILAQSARIGM